MNRSRMWLLTLLFGLGMLPSALWVGVVSADQTTYWLGAGPNPVYGRVVTKWDFPPCVPQIIRVQNYTLPSPAAYPWFFVVSSSTQQTRLTGAIIPNTPAITAMGSPAVPPVCWPDQPADPLAVITFSGSCPNATTMIADARTVGNADPGGGLGTLAVGDTSSARDSLKINVARSGRPSRSTDSLDSSGTRSELRIRSTCGTPWFSPSIPTRRRPLDEEPHRCRGQLHRSDHAHKTEEDRPARSIGRIRSDRLRAHERRPPRSSHRDAGRSMRDRRPCVRSR